MMAPRLIEVLAVLGAVLGLRRLGGIFFSSRTAGIMAGACYALVHAQLDFWHTGQPESFAGPLTVAALVLTTGQWSRTRWPWVYAAIGLLFGLAFLLKPPFGGPAIACAYYLSSQRRSQGYSWPQSLLPVGVIGLTSLLPIALCLAWFAVRGGWDALVWTLFDFAPGYTALSWQNRDASSMFFRAMGEGFFGLSSLLALGTIALASIHPRAENEREALMLILSILAFHFVGITVQGKFFQYHFGASIPLIALMAGQGYYKLWRRLDLSSTSSFLAYAAFLIIAATMKLPVNDTPYGFWERSVLRARYLVSGGRSLSREELDEKIHYVAGYNLDVARQVAHEVTHLSQADERLFVWGFEPAIYWFSERTPSSSYIYNAPLRAPWQAERSWKKLWHDLEQHPPAVIVTQKLDVLPMVTGNRLDSTDSLPRYPRLQAYLHNHYKKVKDVDRFALWSRVVTTSSASHAAD